ncbi:MAG: hypothetical protein ACE5FL_01170 [Myxococcota bacterium]
MRIAILCIASALASFFGVTWYALESGGVAIVATRPANGPERRTHVWYVEPRDELWIEAGTPQNGWFVDLENDRELHFSADGIAARYRALPSSDPADQRRIRSLIRAKYGWRDRWVGMFVDSSKSVPVRLQPLARGG